MDKKLILAVAGSGKTTKIINSINEFDEALLITYTNNNAKQLMNRLMDRFGYLPSNIAIYTYFSFLYSFCFKPLREMENVQGIDYYNKAPKYVKQSDPNYYINPNTRKMYYYRLSKYCKKELLDEIKQRIEKYFEYLYIDEVQDLAGNDFNFIINLVKCLNIDVLMVGDFYQYTYSTSNDGNVNKNLHNGFDKYVEIFINNKINIDLNALSKSCRCTKIICDYVKDNLGINIESNKSDITSIYEIVNENKLDEVLGNDNIVKLFYKDSNKYKLKADNWGNVKGITYENDICVVLNKETYSKYKNNRLIELSQLTKNKLYVALTRTTKNVYLVEEAKLTRYKK